MYVCLNVMHRVFAHPRLQHIRHADLADDQLARSYALPPDPLLHRDLSDLNLPLLAFSYLMRRITVQSMLITTLCD